MGRVSINPLTRKKTMKKYIFLAVAGILALSSCSSDDNEQDTQNAPRQMTFTAGFGDGAQTRTTLSGKSVSFNAYDKISILSAKNANTQFTTTDGGATATFSGTATDDSKFYAVYPYTEGLTLDGSTGEISGIEIPSDQFDAAASDCGWDPAAAIAYATTTDASLEFHNACALLKIYNNGGNDIEITVLSENINMAGTFTLNTSDGSLSGGSERSVHVNPVDYGKTIYIAIAPGTYHNFKASWSGLWGQKGLKQKSEVTFEAGKIYDLGNTNDWQIPSSGGGDDPLG